MAQFSINNSEKAGLDQPVLKLPSGEMTWHLLDANSIWIKEFASALGTMVPTVGWIADFSWIGLIQKDGRVESLENPPVRLLHFPLQRGYSQAPLSWLARLGNVQVSRMARVSNPQRSPLICTTPFYAPVAEKWPGPVVYYLTDMTKEYPSVNRRAVQQFDRRMCAVADAVCPNSQRIADYLEAEAGCSPLKLVVIPQATRSQNISNTPLLRPGALPADIAHLPRPLVGTIGNLAQNTDWVLLRAAIDKNPHVSFVLVGPTSMEVVDPVQRQAREQLMARHGRVLFTGPKPYGQLSDYARCFDVAFLPYQPRNEPTYSGSSTRFYEHLAACRPILATRGFEELLHKEPLLRLVDNPEQVTAALAELRLHGFSDGYEEQRWNASRQGTWEYRAATLKTALESRVGASK